MKTITRRTVVSAVGAICLGAMGSTSAFALDQVSVRLPWLAQAQFAGFYVAKAKGFYESEGLEVTVNPGGPNINGETLVASGADDFAIVGTVDALLAGREKGLPLVAVAMLLQQNPMALVAHEDSGIRTPADFKGKTVSTFFTGAQNLVYAMIENAGLAQEDVKVVPQAVSMAPFLDRQVDVASVTVYNELNVLKAQGLEGIVVINPADYGVNVPSDAIVATEKTIAERPAVVQGFINGSIRGWQYALAHPDEAVEIVMNEASGLEAPHQRAMLDAYGKLMTAGEGTTSGLGVLDMAGVERARDILLSRGVVKPDVDLDDAVNAGFWKAVPSEFTKPQ
ncbi:MAG: ABC transporter substrate-binding protein [Rhizobiaceae bacterium]|nr:ABC transporter substrate-binding protein [Rhizobiaceae bacterium]